MSSKRIPVGQTAALAVAAVHDLALANLSLYVGPLARVAEETGKKREQQGVASTTKSALRNQTIVDELEAAGIHVGRPITLPITPDLARAILDRFPGLLEEIIATTYGDALSICLQEVQDATRGRFERARSEGGSTASDQPRPDC